MKNLNWKRYLFQITFGIFLLFLFLLPDVTKGEGYDSISVIEYYFDQDPGIGNGVILTSDSAPAYVADEVIDISALAEGIHTIWFRAQDSTGLWSVPYGKSFYVYRTFKSDSLEVPVTELEYSFDNNSFASLGAVEEDTSVTLATNLDLAGLSDPGIHTIWFKAKDTQPYLSAVASKSFFIYRNYKSDSLKVPVTELEYSFDNNSFASLGAVEEDTSVTLATNLDLAGLSDPGIHTIWFRAKDTRPYLSAVASKSFFIYRNYKSDSLEVPVTELEYSFDNNSFASLGAVEEDTSVTLATNLDLAGLSDPGIHTIWFRAKDTRPYLSAVTSKSFFVYQTLANEAANIPIVGIEYSFDSVTTFIPIDAALPDTSVTVSDNLNVSNLIGHGDHTIAFRAKAANNVWGNVITGLFSVENVDPLANAGNDLYAGDNTVVSLDGTTSSDLNHDNLIYNWIPPAGIVLSSNNSAIPTFTAPSIIADTNLTFVLYVNDGLIDSPNDTIIVRVIHNIIEISDTTFGSGTNGCVNAFSIITVAGDNIVIFDVGSSTTLIAGQSIRFLPGFYSRNGSYLSAFIENGSGFCDRVAGGALIYQPPVEKSQIISQDELPSVFGEKQVILYPNPNEGRFMLELKNYEGKSEVSVINSIGAIVARTSTFDSGTNQFNLPYLKKGIYFIQIRNENKLTTRKMIVK